MLLFSPETVRQTLRDLAEELQEAGVPTKIEVVGGAAVALQVGRDALTRDIDALFVPSEALTEVTSRMARERGWPEDWLNDAAKQFVSHYDEPSDWDVYLDEGGVTILVARSPLLLAMKLHAARGQRDLPDIRRLIESCELPTSEQAEAIFDRYYPQESLSTRARAMLNQTLGSETTE